MTESKATPEKQIFGTLRTFFLKVIKVTLLIKVTPVDGILLKQSTGLLTMLICNKHQYTFHVRIYGRPSLRSTGRHLISLYTCVPVH